MANGQGHPPNPGGVVAPNFLAIEEAVATVTFPVSKREMMDMMGDGTVLFGGRNVALHDLVRDLDDDYFETEGDFHDALERRYAGALDGQQSDEDPSPLPTGPADSLQARWGPGASGSPDEYLEPPP